MTALVRAVSILIPMMTKSSFRQGADMNKKLRITIMISVKNLKQIEELSEKTQRNRSSMIRILIDCGLRNYREQEINLLERLKRQI